MGSAVAQLVERLLPIRDIRGLTPVIGKGFFLKKWDNPGLFFISFWSFQTNIITIFTTNQCEQISIQYAAPGYEPTTFCT